jgi:TolB-like protein
MPEVSIMNKLFKCFLVFFTIIAVTNISLITEAAQKKVAVMPFESISGSGEKRAAEIMTDQVTVVIANSGNYTVIERTQLAQTLKEINLQNSGIIDPNQAIELGKMSGTDYTIVGKVLMAGVFNNESTNIYRDILGTNNPFKGFIAKYKGKVSLDVRFIDNVTGQLVFAKVIEGSKSGNERDGCLVAACKDAAESILTEIQMKNPFTATVLDTDNGKVYIDKGYDSGLRVGEVLLVFKEMRPITTLDGQIIAMKTTEIGKVKVVEVNVNHSICKIISGDESEILRRMKVKRGK